MHEDLAVPVDQLRTQRTDLLRHQRAENLLGEGRAGGMILQGVGVEQLRAHAVAQHQTIGGSAVVVGGGEALIVHPARAAGGDDDGLGPGHHQLFGFHVHQDGTGSTAVFV